MEKRKWKRAPGRGRRTESSFSPIAAKSRRSKRWPMAWESGLWDFASRLCSHFTASRPSAPPGSPADKPPREWSDAVVNLLFAALDDTDDDFQSWTSSNGPGCSNARVCDVAAYDLNQLDSKRFPFDVSGTWAQRNRSLVPLKNVWRKERECRRYRCRTSQNRRPDFR